MRRTFPLALTLLGSIACGTASSVAPADPSDAAVDRRDAFQPVDAEEGSPGDAPGREAGVDAAEAGGCPEGMVCPAAFPFSHSGDTRISKSERFSSYSCAPTKDEGGKEDIYRIEVAEPSFLSAAVYDDSGVDVDVHILSELDAAMCMTRGDKQASADVTPGVYYVVVDSFVSGGQRREGTYRVDIGLLAPSRGPCAMQDGTMPRVGDNGNSLVMPATGPVVLEAHLVTAEEPAPYPTTQTEELSAHHALSQARTGLVMYREQPWAPLEGGSFYGAGIGKPDDFPVVDEAYYVCMYWKSTSRPAKGTRMILRKPNTSRAVVVAAGYETGPGDLAAIGGAPEEVHFYLGTGHRSTLKLGLASDTGLPLGPRICTD